MAVIAAPGEVWQVKIKCRFEGQEVLNVLHFASAAGSNDVLAQLLQAITNCFILNLLPGLGAAFKLESTVGHRVSPDVGPEIEFIPDQNQDVDGGVDSDTLPTFNSCVVSIRTVRGGRSGRGRMFLSGIPESSTTASKITVPSAYWSAVLAYIACVIAAFVKSTAPAANEWQLGVMSRKIGGATEPYLAAGFAAATGLQPHPEIATTRSRKVGHGS